MVEDREPARGWGDLGALERSKLQEALFCGDEIDPRLVPAALEHLDERRRLGRWFAMGGSGVGVAGGAVAGTLVWFADGDAGGAVFVALLVLVASTSMFSGIGLYMAGQASRRAQYLTGPNGATQDGSPWAGWSWRVGRVLMAGVLAMMTWWWTSLLIVGPGMRAGGLAQPKDAVAIPVGVTVIAALAVGFYRLLAQRDLLQVTEMRRDWMGPVTSPDRCTAVWPRE